jgi:hypothetical protein
MIRYGGKPLGELSHQRFENLKVGNISQKNKYLPLPGPGLCPRLASLDG